MKVKHKNSEEEFDLIKPQYTKLFSMYGYLVQGGNDVYFIVTNTEEDLVYTVTEDFEII